MKEVIIYTDGACSGNPGPGGWAAILNYKGIEKEIYGSEKDTTNNRMELMAPIKALEALKEPCNVRIYTDSAYVCNAFNNGWLASWRRNNWMTSAKKPVQNQDLWKRLIELTEERGHSVTWFKVAGHSGHEENERCDSLAKAAVEQIKKGAR